MYQQTILDNNIRVVTHSMEGVRSISVGFLLDASPIHESPDKFGVAHLTEHLIFKGTSTRDGDEIARMMDITGCSIGGVTVRDYTCFSATVLDDYRTYAIDLLGDMLLHSTFMPADVAMEKSSIAYELSMAHDQPDAYAHDLLKEYVWNNHRLSHPVGGRKETVNQLNRDDVLGFVNDYYRGDHLIVAAAGNLDHKDFVANIHDSLWAMEGNGAPATTPSEATFTPGVISKKRNVNQTYFSLGIEALHYSHKSRYSLHLLTLILGGGVSSRLHHRLRRTQGLVYEVHAEYHAYRDAGIVVIEGATAPDLMEMVTHQIFRELKGLATGSVAISEEELWKAKMQLRGQHIMASESTHTAMSRLGTQMFYFGASIKSEDILVEIEQITLSEINNLAQSLFSNAAQRMTLSMVGPENAKINSEKMVKTIEKSFN